MERDNIKAFIRTIYWKHLSSLFVVSPLNHRETHLYNWKYTLCGDGRIICSVASTSTSYICWLSARHPLSSSHREARFVLSPCDCARAASEDGKRERSRRRQPLLQSRLPALPSVCLESRQRQIARACVCCLFARCKCVRERRPRVCVLAFTLSIFPRNTSYPSSLSPDITTNEKSESLV